MFNVSVFTTAAVAGVPLLWVVLGLVEWAKGIGLKGETAIRLASMGIGLVFGVCYMVVETAFIDAVGQMTGSGIFGAVFGFIVYGIGLGLLASGIYDVGGSLLEKIGTK